jgi:uncharacterized DUF497 family protein
MEFEWDEGKRLSNLEKHGIDFNRARTIWCGDVIDPAAERRVEDEVRRLALGVVGKDEIVIAVVYTDRGQVRRIISARRATRYERQRYQSEFGRGG